MPIQTTEIRFEVDTQVVQVIDSLVQLRGGSRTKVIKEIIENWTAEKIHEASLICRVANVNPFERHD